HLAVQVLWDFDSSAQDWARASPTEMDAEVQWGPSGTLRGTVRGPMPHLDSPPFRVRVNDRCHVVIRMRSSGAATLGRLELRTGSIPKETDHSINPWTQRDSPAVVMTASSSGGSNATLAADGDLYTTWEASSDSNEWVTLDYGVPREVAAVRLKQAPGGDSNPRNIRVQQGRSVGGEFVTAANLTMRNSSDSQQFVVSPSRSRFWRLYVLDTHGNASASLREVEFLGPGDTTVAKPLAFEIVNDDAFHVYHIPIHRSLQGILTQLRLRVGLEAAEDPGRTSASLSPKRGDAFEIDWIRVVRAPNVKRIRGCIDVSYLPPSTPEMGRAVAVFNGTARNVMVNGFLELGRTSLGRVEDAVYGTTKSCQREGGEMITLFGAAFGKDSAQARVNKTGKTNLVVTKNFENVRWCVW
ncbi:unnamed protein product, partial [Sphacelaria rigidula]